MYELDTIACILAAMKYFLIAGEASGDQHGAALMRAILARDCQASFVVWGGDQMGALAGNLRMHYKNYSIMGFVEVLLNIFTIFKLIKQCKADIDAAKPDVLVLIDFPGFNLRMATFAKLRGIKVVYYIAPKVWAWKENRVKQLEQFVDKVLLILPFEPEFYQKYKANVVYVGNPSYEQVAQYKPQHDFLQANGLSDKPIIALLPGSREQEIHNMSPLMKQLAQSYSQYQFVFAGAPSLNPSLYEPYLTHNTHIVFNQTYALLSHSHAAIVCSGTATLETALFDVPQVCGYKANPLSYAIARLMVKIKYISLVNLCMNEKVITELIQHDWNIDTLSTEFEKILAGDTRTDMLAQYKKLKTLLKDSHTSQRSADEVLEVARS
jgi:lipid-A-disaccharide synthase